MLQVPATLGLSIGGGEVGATGADSVTISGAVPLAITGAGQRRELASPAAARRRRCRDGREPSSALRAAPAGAERHERHHGQGEDHQQRCQDAALHGTEAIPWGHRDMQLLPHADAGLRVCVAPG